jgi:hypothetical protein
MRYGFGRSPDRHLFPTRHQLSPDRYNPDALPVICVTIQALTSLHGQSGPPSGGASDGRPVYSASTPAMASLITATVGTTASSNVG